jgi:hypothetical protein
MRFPLALLLLAASPLAAQTADLSISLSAPSSSIALYLNATVMTIVVTNNGPNAATNVVVTESLSLPLNPFFAGSHLTGPGGPCSTFPNSEVCTVGTINSGQSVTIHSNAIFEFGYITQEPTPMNVTETVTSSTSDPNTSNNTASAVVTMHQPTVDLFFELKGADKTTVAAGELVTFSFLTRASSGESIPQGTMTIQPPPGWTFVSSTSGCSGSSVITCPVPQLVVLEETYTANITLRAPARTGPATVTATWSSPLLVDPNPNNNSASVTVTVVPPAPALSPLALLLLGVALAACAAVVLRAA